MPAFRYKYNGQTYSYDRPNEDAALAALDSDITAAEQAGKRPYTRSEEKVANPPSYAPEIGMFAPQAPARPAAPLKPATTDEAARSASGKAYGMAIPAVVGGGLSGFVQEAEQVAKQGLGSYAKQAWLEGVTKLEQAWHGTPGAPEAVKANGDYPRHKAADEWAKQAGYESADQASMTLGSRFLTGLMGAIDATVVGKFFANAAEKASKASSQLYAENVPELALPDVKSEGSTVSGTLRNMLAGTGIRDFFVPLAAEIASNAPAEALSAPVLAGARLARKVATPVERLISNRILARGTNAQYKAAVEAERAAALEALGQSIKKIPDAGMSAEGSEAASNALESALQVAATPNKPQGVKRVLAQAQEELVPSGPETTGLSASEKETLDIIYESQRLDAMLTKAEEVWKSSKGSDRTSNKNYALDLRERVKRQNKILSDHFAKQKAAEQALTVGPDFSKPGVIMRPPIEPPVPPVAPGPAPKRPFKFRGGTETGVVANLPQLPPPKVNSFGDHMLNILAGDKIDILEDDISNAVLHLQQAGSFGRAKAKADLWALEKEWFGGTPYNLSSDIFASTKGFLADSVAQTKNFIASVLGKMPADRLAEYAAAKGLSPAEAQQLLARSVKNATFIHPRMRMTYEAAGRTLFHSERLMPELIQKLDDLTYDYTKALDDSLINPVLDRKGGLDHELLRSSKVPVDKVAQARTKAWNDAWAWYNTPNEAGVAPASRLRASMEEYFAGDKELVDNAMKVIDGYMKHSRGVLEPTKLGMNFDLLPGAYMHHMYNRNPMSGVLAENFRAKHRVTGSSMERTLGEEGLSREITDELGDPMRIMREDANFNLRDVMLKDMSEVHSAKAHNTALDEMFRGGNMGFLKTDRMRFSKEGYLETKALDKARGQEVWRTNKKFRELPLDRTDKWMIRKALEVDGTALEQQTAQKLAEVLDGLPADLDGTPLTRDSLRSVLAVMGNRKIFVREDLHAYFMDMRKHTDDSMRQFMEQAKNLNGRDWTSGHAGAIIPDFLKPAVQATGRAVKEAALAVKQAPGLQKLVHPVGVLNTVIKPLATSWDIGGLGQKIAYYTDLSSRTNPIWAAQVLLKSRKTLDPRDVPTLLKMFERGGLYDGRIGMTEVSSLEDLRYTHGVLPAADRYMAYGDRLLYSSDNFDALGFDSRTRLAAAQVLEKRFQRWHDFLNSDSTLKRTTASLQKFTRMVFGGPDYRKLLTRDGKGLNERAFVDELEKSFGAYNTAARTTLERETAAKLNTFYGWHKGTFLPILTAPLRNPLWHAVAPLYLMDRLNVTLSGHHMWDNETGKEMWIEVNPQKLGLQGDPFYFGPQRLQRMYNAVGGSRLSAIVRKFSDKSYQEAATAGLHYVLNDLPMQLLRGGVVQPNLALNKLVETLDAEVYNRNHENDEVAYNDLRRVVGTFNSQAAQLMDELLKNRTSLTPETLLVMAGGTIAAMGSGQNFSMGPPSTKATAEFQRQLGVDPLHLPDAKTAMEHIVNKKIYDKARVNLGKTLLKSTVGDVLEDIEPNPDTRRFLKAGFK